MFNRWVYIERFFVLGVCGIAPLIAAPWLWRNDASLAAAVVSLAGIMLVSAIAGILLGLLFHRTLTLGSIPWGGHEETAALVKQAIGEIIGGNADDKLNQQAITQANAQEGRATGIYLTLRLSQLRQQKSKTGGAANPITLGTRIFWIALGLALASLGALQPKLVPQLNPNWALLGLAVLAPLWLTALAIAGFGIASASQWIPIPGGNNKEPKIKARGSRSAAGSWHTKNNRSDVPLFRIILITPIAIATALYLLREYGPQPTQPGFDEVSFQEDADIKPSPPQAIQPALREKPGPKPAAPSQKAIAQQQKRVTTQAVVDEWDEIPPNGNSLKADQQALQYAGWNSQDLLRALDESRQRVNQWYFSHLRDNPTAIGRISLRLSLNPGGYISDIEVLASEIGDPTFTNALRDRLEASALPTGATDNISVVLSMDFRP